ncbi:hypothetical protein [Streptomyces anulatus]|uniref:hypothetical protein n=1 Tax=Streptomyces anulatus TaxID=1892 RepID=UPI001C265458|nr:hypothetical protein [Streptomyces anulatus]
MPAGASCRSSCESSCRSSCRQRPNGQARGPDPVGDPPVGSRHLAPLPQPSRKSVRTRRHPRTALRDSHLTLALAHGFPTGEDARITDDFIDEVLLDGEPVRIVKATPAT